jgi:hypothetical protein
MRARTKAKETKELKKKKTKKVNIQDHGDEIGIVQNNLAHEKESKFNFFNLFNNELKKFNDISLGYEDILQRLLLKSDEFKNENIVHNQNRNSQNQIICYSPSSASTNQNIDNNYHYEK